MRESKVIERPARTPSVRVLDDVSDHMAQVLRQADELLAEWARFGASVRGQVERETVAIGDAVATSIDRAVAQAVATTEAGVDRAVVDAVTAKIGAQLQTLALELGRLEARAKAANRALGEQRAADRRILWGIAGGLAIAIGLLVVLVLRKPPISEPMPAPVPIVEPKQDLPKPPDPAPAVDPAKADAVSGAGVGSGSDTVPAGLGSGEKAPPPAKKDAHGGAAHGAGRPARKQ
jgi:hypothetical protein